jgi:hypothetical protein
MIRPVRRRPTQKEKSMVLEIVQFDAKPGLEAVFDASAAKAVPLFRRAKGCSALTLHRSVEKPSRYPSSPGRRWKTTPLIFAARRISPN